MIGIKDYQDWHWEGGAHESGSEAETATLFANHCIKKFQDDLDMIIAAIRGCGKLQYLQDDRLIAAAPEMLDILNRILFEFSELSDIRTEYQSKVLQDAIKLVDKIEGEL